jgi:biotin carboxyl carrier protein
MQIEINKDNRSSEVEILEKTGSIYKVSVDGRIYELDLLMVEEGVWSVLNQGKSQIVEAIPGDQTKKYFVNTFTNSFEVEMVDAETRYIRSRNKGSAADAQSQITVPMPGKIVKVYVKPGDEVKEGDTLVIVSAMKMESEYKAGKDGLVKEVLVKDDDTVDGGQVMVELEGE